MVSYRDRTKALSAARLNERFRVSLALSWCDGHGSLPVRISRSVNLEVTLVEMCAFIHTQNYIPFRQQPI